MFRGHRNLVHQLLHLFYLLRTPRGRLVSLFAVMIGLPLSPLGELLELFIGYSAWWRTWMLETVVLYTITSP